MVLDAAVCLIQSLILDTASHFIDGVILLSLLGFSVADSSTDFGIEAAKRDSSTIAGCMETGRNISVAVGVRLQFFLLVSKHVYRITYIQLNDFSS